MTGRVDRVLGAAIFCATLALFLLSSGREPPWGDANVQYMAAESMLRRGALDIPKPWPDDLPPDEDGAFHSTYPLLTSAVQLPGLLLFEGITELSPASKGLVEPLTSHLACSLFGALCCLLFFRLCRQQGVSATVSSAATAILAVATTVWVYAHYSYSEIAQAAFFTGFLLALLRLDQRPSAANGRWFGLWAGVLFSVKYIYAASIVGAGVFLLVRYRSQWRLLLRLTGWAAVTAVPFLAAALIYNALCWGSPFRTGYHPYFQSYWGENILVGAWGMFLSPGKSVFLYSPPLLLGLGALPTLWRRHRAACLAVLAAAGPVVLIYARYKLNGDYAWGPRFIVFVVPALALGFAVLMQSWQEQRARWHRRGLLAAAVAAGLCVQLLGNAFYWDHYIRISMEASQDWLGEPDRAGAIIPVRDNGRCDSCFEDVHQLQWLPPFQPILGHLWLARAQLAGDDWREAEARAPWHRHTSLQLDIERSYARVRLDWWGMLWLRDFPAYRGAGIGLLAIFALATALGAAMWVRAHRLARTREHDGADGVD